MTDHTITIIKPEGQVRSIAVCSCRRWRSNAYVLRSDAEKAGDVHMLNPDMMNTARAALNRTARPMTGSQLRAELKWYESSAEDMTFSEGERRMWKMLADELRPRVPHDPEDSVQDELF